MNKYLATIALVFGLSAAAAWQPVRIFDGIESYDLFKTPQPGVEVKHVLAQTIAGRPVYAINLDIAEDSRCSSIVYVPFASDPDIGWQMLDNAKLAMAKGFKVRVVVNPYLGPTVNGLRRCMAVRVSVVRP